MITWVTLFLALVAGPHEVEISADESVARIELLLDGRPVGVREAPPWSFEIDLGRRLTPHRLEAVAWNAQGEETSRIRQILNLPRPQAEARLALEEGREGRYRSARLVWDVVGDLELVAFRVLLDGEPLAAEDPQRIPLPDYDPGSIHHLAAELELEDELTAHAAVTFGGRFGGSTESDLTPLAVRWIGKEPPSGGRSGEPAEPPAPETVAGWFLHDGEPVRAFTVDRPPADVLVLRSRTVEPRLARLGSDALKGESPSFGDGPVPREIAEKLGLGLEPGDRLRFVCPVPNWTADRSGALFPATGDVAESTGGLGFALTHLAVCRPGDAEAPQVERLADAVAAAGVLAAAGGRRRAVVLVVHPRARDASQNNPGPVKGYLETLRVPLRIWSPVGGKTDWGSSEGIGKPKRLRREIRELRGDLDRQWVVWLEGRWLPQEIELSKEARRFIEWAH